MENAIPSGLGMDRLAYRARFVSSHAEMLQGMESRLQPAGLPQDAGVRVP